MLVKIRKILPRSRGEEEEDEVEDSEEQEGSRGGKGEDGWGILGSNGGQGRDIKWGGREKRLELGNGKGGRVLFYYIGKRKAKIRE